MKVKDVLPSMEENLILLGLAPPKKSKRGKKQKFFGPYAGVGFYPAPTPAEPPDTGADGGGDSGGDGGGGGE